MDARRSDDGPDNAPPVEPGPGHPANTRVADALARCLAEARTDRRRDNVRTILMFSGGLDSVVLLAKLLECTNHTVHAHHIELVNFENRWRAENAAVERVADYCRRRYRDFALTRSRSEFNIGKGGGTDLQLAMFTAARLTVALGGTADIVMTGHITPPFWELSEGAAVFNAAFINRKHKPEWLRPLAYLKGAHFRKKLDIWEAVPEELAAMAWSCRRPVEAPDGFAPCGTCQACRADAAIRKARGAAHRAAATVPGSGPA